jgi:hypothetical protein
MHLVKALSFPGFFIVRKLGFTTYRILAWFHSFAIGSPIEAVIFSDAKFIEASFLLTFRD